MGYIFLLCTLLSGAIKGFCGKKTSNFVNEYNDAVFASTLRLIFCTIIGFLIVFSENGIQSFKIDTTTCVLALISGVSTLIFIISWLFAVKNSAYMLVDVFLTVGLIVPLIGSTIMFNEQIMLTQYIGLTLLLVSVLIMCSYNNSIKAKLKFSSFLLLVICGISNGIADLTQKIFAEYANNEISVSVFNFYIYLFATIILCIISLFNKNENRNSSLKRKSFLGYIFIMSICLFSASYFKVKAAAILPAIQLYPLCQGGALILSSFIASVFFKEKLKYKCVIGIILSFISLIIINVL